MTDERKIPEWERALDAMQDKGADGQLVGISGGEETPDYNHTIQAQLAPTRNDRDNNDLSVDPVENAENREMVEKFRRAQVIAARAKIQRVEEEKSRTRLARLIPQAWSIVQKNVMEKSPIGRMETEALLAAITELINNDEKFLSGMVDELSNILMAIRMAKKKRM